MGQKYARKKAKLNGLALWSVLYEVPLFGS